jgi:hypothetical protein
MHGSTLGSDGAPPRADFLIDGRRYEPGSPEFADGIASAYAKHHRPCCLCVAGGIEMYVAHLGDGFIVKRMPGTGSRHATDCPSYEPPAEFSGLGEVLGSAIREDPATGETTLRLGFPMSKIRGRSTTPNAGSVGDSVSAGGNRLSLRGLLHYLWDQAELTRWRPGFAGKRSWATVRRHLLLAAEHKVAGGGALDARLHIPEVFSVEQRDAINARRSAQWARAVAASDNAQQLMLMIAEVKEILPARYGFKAVVKHVPDQAFMIDEQLYRRLERRFEHELSLWGATENVHMVMIATYGISESGVPAIAELSLMPVTSQWLPIEDSFEQQLIQKLVQDGRSFVKGLRYNTRVGQSMASLILTDVGISPIPLYIAPRGVDGEDADTDDPTVDPLAWRWATAREAMPPLPPRQPRAIAAPSEVPQTEVSI